MSPERTPDQLADAFEAKLKRFESGERDIIGCTDEELLEYLVRGFAKYCMQKMDTEGHL